MGIIGNASGDAVYSEKEFHKILARERCRSTRSGCPFSVACFQLNKGNGQTSANPFIAHLKGMIRSTDEMGWFDANSIGVLLYNTAREGASYFAKKVKAAAVSQNSLAKCSIYTYPSEWFDIRNNNPEQEISQPPLVLPLWKRALDILAVCIGLILLSPVFMLLAIAIKIGSPGPVFFKQERIGYNGKPFTFWKFRTMKTTADISAHRKYMEGLIEGTDGRKPMTKQDDTNPHIIPFGRILRKAYIDEFPQFINVLRGEMSLVGPRPPIPYEVKKYEHWHKERFNALPGLTGLWQVSGKNRLTFNEMVRLDIKYVRNISLWQDLKILLLTPKAMLS